MQSTGHSSTHARSFTSMQDSQIVYVMEFPFIYRAYRENEFTLRTAARNPNRSVLEGRGRGGGHERPQDRRHGLERGDRVAEHEVRSGLAIRVEPSPGLVPPS